MTKPVKKAALLEMISKYAVNGKGGST